MSTKADQSQPSKKEERQQWMEVVGKDGHRLLAAIFQPNTPQWLRQIPAVETLRQVWVQQFYLEGDQVVTRTNENLPRHQQMIASPYDIELAIALKEQRIGQDIVYI